jgi:hypothetical protein
MTPVFEQANTVHASDRAATLVGATDIADTLICKLGPVGFFFCPWVKIGDPCVRAPPRPQP